MRDAVVGSIADLLLLGALAWAARRLLDRPRDPYVLVGWVGALAAWLSNLLDRFGLHRITAPGSARGTVDWIPIAAGSGSPMDLADLVILAAALMLAGRFLLQRTFSPHHRTSQRIALAAGVAIVTAVSLVGAFHADDGVHVRPVTLVPTTRIMGGVPAGQTAAGANAIQWLIVTGSTITIDWSVEVVTVNGDQVRGTRVDRSHAIYLYVRVIGPESLDLYLPIGAAACEWHQLSGPTPTSVLSWECNSGTPALSLSDPPTRIG